MQQAASCPLFGRPHCHVKSEFFGYAIENMVLAISILQFALMLARTWNRTLYFADRGVE